MNQKKLIKRIIDVAYTAKEGHIPSSLSILNILYVLYNTVLKDINNKFILSKGHASLGLYVILEEFGLLTDDLSGFCGFNSNLGAHPTNKIPNILASTGSLGHGLPFAVGIAMAQKIKKIDGRTFVIIGDGEANEGTIWESALLASNHNLDNLCCILDYNRSNDRALKLDSLLNKFNAFNWYTIEVDGHDNEALLSALTMKTNKPIFVLANTIKGYGCKRMENNPEWHHKSPNDEEYLDILKYLDVDI